MTVAGVPLNVTAEEFVNPVPVIVTGVPATAAAGETPTIDRVGVKLVVLVPVPAAVVTVPAGADVFVTLTRPLVAGCSQEICNWVAV